MKRSISSLVLSVPVALASCAVSLFGVPAANAAAPASNTPPATGVITVCPGVSYSLFDVNGVPITKDREKIMAEHMRIKCEYLRSGEAGLLKSGTKRQETQSKAAPGTLTPMGTETDAGYLSAVLNISPGAMSYWATASSMPPNTPKTLSCEISMNNGPFQDCGSADGYSTTYLSTRTNEECPYPDQPVEVDAWLNINGADYWDAAYGTTQ